MLNRPKYYNLHLVTIVCDHCHEEYVYPDVQLAREIPKGEAWSPPPKGATVFNIPVRYGEAPRTVPFCSMCEPTVPRAALPAERDRAVVSVARGVGSVNGATPPPASSAEAEAMLKQLGLL